MADADDNSPSQITRITLDESMVAEWLENHPDFFDRHPDALSRLEIRHEASGGAASLIERQVQTLRSRLANMQTRFDEMVSTARENEHLQERLHRVSLAATSAASLDNAIDTIPELLKKEFEIDHVALRFVDQIDTADIEHWSLLHDRVAHGRSICDDRIPLRVREFLFGSEAPLVASCAILPLPEDQRDMPGVIAGVIALGSTDETRFNHAMGTVYLDRLGEIVSSGLRRLRDKVEAA